MELHIIYTESKMYLSKKRYGDWREIQDEYADYKASFGPWSVEQVIEFLEYDYPGLTPTAQVQANTLLGGVIETVELMFKDRG